MHNGNATVHGGTRQLQCRPAAAHPAQRSGRHLFVFYFCFLLHAVFMVFCGRQILNETLKMLCHSIFGLALRCFLPSFSEHWLCRFVACWKGRGRPSRFQLLNPLGIKFSWGVRISSAIRVAVTPRITANAPTHSMLQEHKSQIPTAPACNACQRGKTTLT